MIKMITVTTPLIQTNIKVINKTTNLEMDLNNTSNQNKKSTKNCLDNNRNNNTTKNLRILKVFKF